MCKLRLLDPLRENVVRTAPINNIKPIEIHSIANIVPMALQAEQEALKEDIENNGYKQELGLILLWKGEIVDGRCRQKALIELDIDPRGYTSELGELSYEEVSSLVKSTNTRRNLTTTQKAISAYMQTRNAKWGTCPPKEKQVHQRVASKTWGVDKKMITYVSSIVKSVGTIVTEMKKKNTPPNTILYAKIKRAEDVYEKIIRYDQILQNLFDGHQVKIDSFSSYTESVKTVAKQLKVIAESLVMEVLAIEEIEWNPEGLIKTELGKERYYSLVSDDMPTDQKMSILELVNTVYSLPDTMSINVPINLGNVMRDSFSILHKLDTEDTEKWIQKKVHLWQYEVTEEKWDERYQSHNISLDGDTYTTPLYPPQTHKYIHCA